MRKNSLRCRALPLFVWRALFFIMAVALPLRSPIMHAAPAAKNAAAEKKQITASGLIAEVEKGIALIGRGAKEARLDPKSRTAAPFFAALKTVTQNVATLKKQLAAKEGAYFKTLSDTATAVGKLRVTAPRIGVTNKTINEGTKIVFDSFDALRANFGKEAARKKAGGALSAGEKAVLAKLRDQQAALVAKLAPVREKAAKSGNKKLAADLDGLFRQSKVIASAKETLGGFLLALQLFDYLTGEYEAYTYYVPVAYRTDWKYVDTCFQEGETVYWEYYESYSISDWSYYETTEITYSYDYEWNVSLTETEVAEYTEYVEESSYDESSYEESSQDEYIDEASYEESYAENEDEQDSSWEDTEEEIAEDADEVAGEEEDASDDSDSSDDEADADDSGDSGDDEADADDGDDAGADEADADDGDDAGDDEEDADDGDDSGDDEEDADDGDDAGDDEEDADDGDDSGDDEGDSDDGGDDSGDE